MTNKYFTRDEAREYAAQRIFGTGYPVLSGIQWQAAIKGTDSRAIAQRQKLDAQLRYAAQRMLAREFDFTESGPISREKFIAAVDDEVGGTKPGRGRRPTVRQRVEAMMIHDLASEKFTLEQLVAMKPASRASEYSADEKTVDAALEQVRRQIPTNSQA
jgi:hypothetical protein